MEKFIGDAVVGVFGVPTAHEDDAERAVRAAVRLQERMADLHCPNDGPPQARVGVNTGHALVRLDVDPASGEGFQAGDAVNTAARLQTVAPPGGVVVGEMTRSMAAGVATYEADGPGAAQRQSPIRAAVAGHGRHREPGRGPEALVRHRPSSGARWSSAS